MDFKTFDKCMILIKAWRSRTQREDFDWPDSRDPAIREILEEFGVVPQDLEKSMAALAAWREACLDVYPNMSAVLHVIRNRSVKGLVRSHLTDSQQFTSMTQYDGVRGLNTYPEETENFKMLLKNIDDILEGRVRDVTQGALYFGYVQETMPEWFRAIVESDKYERTVQSAGVTFYKEKK